MAIRFKVARLADISEIFFQRPEFSFGVYLLFSQTGKLALSFNNFPNDVFVIRRSHCQAGDSAAGSLHIRFRVIRQTAGRLL